MITDRTKDASLLCWRGKRLPELRKGKRPAYQRLYEAFRVAILKHQLLAGQRVPSSRDLAAFYGVARITVVQAYEQLCAEGYLEGRRGAGTFVAAELPEGFMGSAASDENRNSARAAKKSEASARARYREQSAFLSGCPDLDRFPRELWLKLYQRHLRGSPQSLNTYGHGDGGFAPLRGAIAAYLNTHRGLVCDADQILILSGSQPGIELVARALVQAGDLVAVEDPSYRGIATSFRANGAQLIGIAIDGDGLRVEDLRALRKAPRVTVVTPSRQFPLGCVMPINRRAALLEWAHEKRAWILEDDYDSEFRFRGNPLPAMQGMDEADCTLYLGTFSRSMFPDLRIGYLVVPRHVYPDFEALWQAGGMNPPIAMQATLADFLREGHYQRHLRRMRQHYAKRCGILASLVEQRLGEWLELGLTDGGLHFVAWLRKPLDAAAVARRLSDQEVLLTPLSRYVISPLERQGFTFGFSSFDEPTMINAIEKVRCALEAADAASRPVVATS